MIEKAQTAALWIAGIIAVVSVAAIADAFDSKDGSMTDVAKWSACFGLLFFLIAVGIAVVAVFFLK